MFAVSASGLGSTCTGERLWLLKLPGSVWFRVSGCIGATTTWVRTQKGEFTVC